MALPLTETDKLLLLSAFGAPESRDRIAGLLDLAGTGNMTGPASAIDNALVRFDGTTGALVQNSGVTLDDSNNLAGIANLSMSGSFAVGDGTAAAPAYAFTNDPDVGMYRVGTNQLGLSTAGALALLLTATGRQQGVAGTVGSPAISFINDPDTGLYNSSANVLAVATAGTLAGAFYSNAINGNAGSASNPGFGIIGDEDTGMYQVSSNVLGLTAGSTQMVTVTSTGVGIWDAGATANAFEIRRDQAAVTLSLLRNNSTSASAFARSRLTTNAGNFEITAGSTASGALVSMAAGSGFTGGLNINSDDASGAIRFGTAGTQRGIIDGSGIRVGTSVGGTASFGALASVIQASGSTITASTTTANSVISVGAHVNDGTNNKRIAIFADHLNQDVGIVYGASSGAPTFYIVDAFNANTPFSINGSGNITMGVGTVSVTTAVDNPFQITRSSSSATGLRIGNTTQDYWVGTSAGDWQLRAGTNSSGTVLITQSPTTSIQFNATGIQWNRGSAAAATVSHSLGASDGVHVFGGGTGTSNGAQLRVYGGSHASQANVIAFHVGTTVQSFISSAGSHVHGPNGLATTATDGFLYVPTSAGAPTGVPSSFGSRSPIHIDETNGRIYAYYGGAWHFATLT